MKVRLTRKLAQLVDGIDLSSAREGDTLDLPADQAKLIVAEGWAIPVSERSGTERACASDRTDRKRRPKREGSGSKHGRG